jgi:hypothetical protein
MIFGTHGRVYLFWDFEFDFPHICMEFLVCKFGGDGMELEYIRHWHGILSFFCFIMVFICFF